MPQLIRFNIALCAFLLISSLARGQDIVILEYFVDHDPGFGNATAIPISQDSVIDVEISLPLDGLTPGVHTLYLRAKDSLDRWSFIQKQTFLYEPLVTNPDITVIEYYFDDDPGLGLASPLVFNPDPYVAISEGLDLSGLSVGHHTLYTRVRDENNRWSYPQKQTFLYEPLVPDPDITTVEYYFDIDPGWGSASPFTFTPNLSIDISEGLDLSALAAGHHTLYSRAQDQNNRWSFPQKQAFLYDPATAIVDPNIALLEYYIDEDPGLAEAIPLAVVGESSIDVDTAIDLNTLEAGAHILYARAQDEVGRWSFPQKQSFLFDDQRIEYAQFKFDSLPGFSDWTSSNPFTPDFTVIADIDFEGICDLDTGWYHIDARVRRELSWLSDIYTDSIEIKEEYDYAGVLRDQFGDPIPGALMHFAGADTLPTDGAGLFSTLLPKCWGDTISAFKDSVYSAVNSYYFANPLVDFRAHHILGDLDTALYGYKCLNNSGTTGSDIAYVCENNTLNVSRVGETIDTGSIGGYILHDGDNTIGSIIDSNFTGSFTNDGSYPRNQKLYISSVVGRPSNGFPDFHHPCTDVELPGRKVVFLDIRDSSFLQLDSSGVAAVDPMELLIDGCSSCEIANTGMTQAVFGCDDYGLNSELLLVDNGSGSNASCPVWVQVNDTITPVITCRTDTLVHTDPAMCDFTSLNGLFDLDSIWDNCPIVPINDFNNSTSLDNASFGLGVHQVKWLVADSEGNADSCTFNVTIEDHEDPVIMCISDTTVATDTALCTYTIQGTSFDPLAVVDNCPDFTFSNDSTNTSTLLNKTFELGSHLITWTVDDQHGQTAQCSFTITVEDTEAPEIVCPASTIVSSDPGECSYLILDDSFDPIVISDNCTDLIYWNDFDSSTTIAGASLPLGINTFNWMADDQHGNTATCTISITVEDNEIPIINCPENATRYTSEGLCTYLIEGSEFAPVLVSDNCMDFIFDNNLNNDSSLTAELLTPGDHLITWTVDDMHGQNASCSFTVSVQDTQPPTIICPADTIRTTDAVSCDYSIQGIEFNPTATGDNCPGYTFTNTFNSNSTLESALLPLGETLLTWTIIDQGGNTDECSFTVTILDNESPTISCPDTIVRATDPELCEYTIQGSELNPLSVADNCDAFVISNNINNSDSLSEHVFPTGDHAIVWTVDDNHGQTASCGVVLEVVDMQEPLVTCPDNISLTVDAATCDSSITYDILYSDNCPGAQLMLISGNGTGSSFEIGQHIESFQVTDASGLTAVCAFSITVEQQIIERSDTICLGDSIFLANEWQYNAGIYIDTLTNGAGCDSVVQTTLFTTTECTWPTHIVYVDSAATSGLNTGFDWPNAHIDLQLALDVASRYQNVTQIWVANGTYVPTATGSRTISFDLPSEIEIYGGFAGGENDVTMRNPLVNTTVLSGNIGNPESNTDNSRHVVLNRVSATNVTLDGFVICAGAANFGSSNHLSGGGLRNRGNLYISNTIFQDNTSTNEGSAIFNFGSDAQITLHNCIFENNNPEPILNKSGGVVKSTGNVQIKQ